MMSHPNVRSKRIREMFAMLAVLDDSAILEIIRRYEADDFLQQSVLKGFRALTGVVPPASDTTFSLVSRIGIVGASSVTTAYWPYLILAYILGIPVKIKMHPPDVHHITMLSEIILASSSATNDLGISNPGSGWEVTSQAGDALLTDGYWDDCDRLLVFGSDLSVALYRHHFSESGRVIGFGHLESVMLVALESLQTDSRWVDDLLTFGHIGCLAPRVIVPIDDGSPEQIADLMLTRLQGLVTPDIGRAVTLRNEFHSLRIAGIDAWLSADGMWLISADMCLPMRAITGHLNVVSRSTLATAGCTIGALTVPDMTEESHAEIRALQSAAMWKCAWGTAQFPSMLWANGGVSILATLSH